MHAATSTLADRAKAKAERDARLPQPSFWDAYICTYEGNEAVETSDGRILERTWMTFVDRRTGRLAFTYWAEDGGFSWAPEFDPHTYKPPHTKPVFAGFIRERNDPGYRAQRSDTPVDTGALVSMAQESWARVNGKR